MRKFLKNENASLDVKCTAWLAGFPYRNREVVIGNYPQVEEVRIENYYKESGNLLNGFYNGKESIGLLIDYIGPSIDTGFRLTGFSSPRKMIVSIDVAYIISMTSFDGEVGRIDLHYEGSHLMKGVMGGSAYPIFWINMSSRNSLAVKEDKLRSHTICNREDLKEYCDAFFEEYNSFTFRPFIKGDVGQTLAKMPNWYEDYHSSLVKNFNLPDNEYSLDDVTETDNKDSDEDEHFIEIIDDFSGISDESPLPSFSIGALVNHKKFGNGRVIDVDGNKVEVKFENYGNKRVLDAFIRAR